jgi:hypothetical protein
MPTRRVSGAKGPLEHLHMSGALPPGSDARLSSGTGRTARAQPSNIIINPLPQALRNEDIPVPGYLHHPDGLWGERPACSFYSDVMSVQSLESDGRRASAGELPALRVVLSM